MEHGPRPLASRLNHPQLEEAPPASPSFDFKPVGGGGDTTHGLFPLHLKAEDLESGQGVRPGVRADGGTRAGLKNTTSRVELLNERGSTRGFGRVMVGRAVDQLKVEV